MSKSGNASSRESGELAVLDIDCRVDAGNVVSRSGRASRAILACRRLALMPKGDGEREDGSSSSMMMLSGLEMGT